MRVSECYTFELAIITSSRYNAIFTNGIISFTSVLQYLSKTVTIKWKNLAKDTVRRFCNKTHQRIAEDIITQTKSGGPGTVVEIDESKFGKQKYSYGRMVEEYFDHGHSCRAIGTRQRGHW